MCCDVIDLILFLPPAAPQVGGGEGSKGEVSKGRQKGIDLILFLPPAAPQVGGGEGKVVKGKLVKGDKRG